MTDTAAAVGRSCPYCRFPLKQGAPMLACPACHAVHHADCWNDNGGCAVMGCTAAPASSARPAASPGPQASYPTAELTIPVAPAPSAPAQPAVPPGISASAPATTAPGKGRSPVIPALIVLIVALGGALGYVLSQSGSKGDSQRAASTQNDGAATDSETPAEDTPSPAPTRDPDHRTMAALDGIITLSKIGKRQAGTHPSAALINRHKVMRRLSGLSPESARLRTAVGTFKRAIRASITANELRASGGDPSSYDAQATALKQEFVRQVDGIAAKYGYGPYNAGVI